MAERYQVMDHGRQHYEASGKATVILMTSVAGIALGGLFLVMMGFSFLASLTLLLLTTPLLIIFSPLLFGAGCVFAFAMAGFALAACLGFAGLSSIYWVFRGRLGVARFLSFNIDDVMNRDKLKMESGQDVNEHGKDWAGYTQHKVSESSRFL